jgi:hypothetical protein
LVWVALGAAGTPGSASAAEEALSGRPAIYKWVDEHGIAHYTTDETRIPRAIRKRMRSLGGIPEEAAAPPRAAPVLDLVGPLPQQPGRPEGWVTRNAAPPPTEEETEALEADELSAQLEAMDAEIAGLEEAIADREEQLLAFLATGNDETFNQDGFFRAIVREIPALQADLEALRERRGEIATTP